MKLIHLFLASTLIFSPVTLGSCAYLAQQSRHEQVTTEQFTLNNGLKVYLTHNSLEPRFRAHVIVNAGSKQDPANATGIAHYLEHMLFKGTQEMGTMDFAKEKPLLDEIVRLYDQRFQETDEKKREALQMEINRLSVQVSQYAIPGEMDSLYARLGANGLNAYTSDEETVYLVDLPKNRLEQWAMIESNRFYKPVFRLFQSELETVYEEKNRSLDNKERILSEAVEQQLYKKHPYGTQTTLGRVEHLKNPSLSQMYKFYSRYYVPNNMAIAISGDIDIPEAKRLIQKYFGKWEKAMVPDFSVPHEPPIKGVERVQVQYKGEEKVLLAFRTAAHHTQDQDALTMIDMLLDSGEVGLIRLNLVQPQKVRGAGSFPRFNNDYGAQYLYGIPKEGQSLAEVERLLLQQIESVKKGDFEESTMQGIVLDFEISLKKRLESNEGRTDILTDSFLKGLPLSYILNQPERLRKLTKQDMMRVANQYFGANYVVGYRLDKEQEVPKLDKPKLDKIGLNPDRHSAFAKQVEAVKPEPISPRWVDYQKDFQVKSYAPGVLYHHVNNPLNDLFNFTIYYEFGSKHYPNFCYVIDELDFAGTGNMSAEAVKQYFYNMGISVDFSCGDWGFAMNLSGEDAQFEKGLKLGEQVLWSAVLDEARFKAKIDNIITDRVDQKKDVNSLRRAMNAYLRYGEESNFLDRPSASTLKTLSTSQYPDMREALKKQNFRIYYVGQLPMDKVESLVHQYHQPQQINVPLLNPRKAPEDKLLRRHTKPVKIYFLNHDSVQSHITLILPEQAVDPQENLITSYYNEYMDGGMGALVFQEIRESRALAYSAWTRYFQGSRLGDQDQMLGYIGTQADKTVEAMQVFLNLLKNTPESPSHFDRSHKSLDNAYRTDYIHFRKVLGMVEYWADLGFAKDPRPADFARLDQVMLKDLMKYAQDRVSSKNMTFAIVGDKSRIDMKALGQIGEIEEVNIDQLFTD